MKKFALGCCLIFMCNLFAQPPVQPGLRVLYIGDSITDGNWGGGGALPAAQRNHWDQNHLFGSGYMYLCAAYYMGSFPERKYQFYNRGISGHTLADLAARWQEDVMDLSPDILSVLVGVNDVEYAISDPEKEFDPQEWERLYRELLDRTRTRFPEVKLVLGAPFAAGSVRRENKGEAARYDALIRLCAEITEKIAGDYQAVFLPYHEMYEELYDVLYPSVPVTYWLWDGVHPTAAAHQRMAELWMKKVDKWMR
ncbi:MAG: SGNH/GDSL hydrolase family protein [Bacteroides sp.]|nr:SGNH/GDSL hydrolase family protein [Bacteroides sp.]